MPEISFHTTYSDNQYLLARSKSGSQSGLHGRWCHRFGFNGKENDNEVKGIGNQQDYGMRIYDPRLGRFLSVDPLTSQYPWYTPYQFAGNTPIQAVDIDGAEPGYAGKNGELTYAGNTTSFEDGSIDPGNYLWEWTDKGWENRGGAPFLFEGFSAGKVQLQLLARMNDPSKIDQGWSNTCGMAACAMVFAAKDSRGYAKFIMDLATTGAARYNGYAIHLTSYLSNTNSNYFNKSGMDETDWILLAAMRNYANDVFPYGGGECNWGDNFEFFFGSNTHWEVRRTIEAMGFTINENTMDPIHSQAFSALSELRMINAQITGTSILLIHSNMYNGGSSWKSNHFVVYAGGLVIDERQKTVQFNIWNYGCKQPVECSFEQFKNNYYGRISIKK